MSDTIVPDNGNKTVSIDAHNEVVQDLLKRKQEAKELKDKLSAFEKEKEDLKVKSLKEKEEWQKLAEIREKEAEELKKKLEAKEKVTSNYFKRAEVRQQALKNNIRENALDDLDLLGFDDVQIETTSTGSINVLGADKFVDRLKATKPHWFQDKADPKVVSTSPAASKPTSVTAKDAARLYKEGKMAEYNEAMTKLRTKQTRG
jgi:hypothetical protein